MTEVKRYTFKGAAGEYVYARDFDASQAREAELRALLLNTKGWLSKNSEVYQEIDKIEPLAGGWEFWPDGGPGLGDFAPVDVRFRNGTEAHGCVVGTGSASLNRFYWPRTTQQDPGMDIVAIRRLPKNREGLCLNAFDTIVANRGYPIEPLGIKFDSVLSKSLEPQHPEGGSHD